MSSANVLPSSPPADTRLCPVPPESDAKNFIADEAEHYRLILKKYKKVRKVIHVGVVSLDGLATLLSFGAIAAALMGVGIVVGAPVVGVAALFGAASTGLCAVNKKLERGVHKHAEIHSLVVSKHDTINGLVSRALDDNKVTDREFQLIVAESNEYRGLKESLRSTSRPVEAPSAPAVNLEAIRNEIRNEF